MRRIILLVVLVCLWAWWLNVLFILPWNHAPSPVTTPATFGERFALVRQLPADNHMVYQAR